MLIASRELARRDDYSPTLLRGEAWDVVLLDEAHHARRSGQSQDSANKLMALVRRLRTTGKARGLLFLSATPMQIHPFEPWDLCSVLGQGGEFHSTFGPTEALFGGIAALERGTARRDDLAAVERFLTLTPERPKPPAGVPGSASGFAQTAALLLPQQQRHAAEWLRSFAPLNVRMHRNTRRTLRGYYQLGMLPDPPPERDPQDHHIEFPEGGDEERLYTAVDDYIEERYEALEQRGRGKGFVMTIYRRRAASSPFALAESLRRRAQLLQKRSGRWMDLLPDEFGDAEEREELEQLGLSEEDAAYQDLPAREIGGELAEIAKLRPQIEEIMAGEKDSKFRRFARVLEECRHDGRPVLVFTGYTDTMLYLRENLQPLYGSRLACYSGDGGSVWDDGRGEWRGVDKAAVSRRLNDGDLAVLVCTDAASEGLNLQAAGALINYDLPWNPSKVEQRVGRIDRIGQKHRCLPVHNLFMAGGVEQAVYAVLGERCLLFEQFVGAMQPILAFAAKRLLTARPSDAGRIRQELEQEIDRRQGDPLAAGTYRDATAEQEAPRRSAASRAALVQALADLRTVGVGVAPARGSDGLWRYGRRLLAVEQSVLEENPGAWPFTCGSPIFDELLLKAHLRVPAPLAIEQRERNGAAAAAVSWTPAAGEPRPVDSAEGLAALLKEWTGAVPPAGQRLSAKEVAGRRAARRVSIGANKEAARYQAVVSGLVAAARERLREEVTLTLACIALTGERFDSAWFRRMSGRSPDDTLQAAHKRLGYLKLSAEEEAAYRQRVQTWPQAKRNARNTLSDVRNALEDWRWGLEASEG